MAWRRALGASGLEGREGQCSSRLWALGTGGCPHQALCDPPYLLCLDEVLELFPLQDLRHGKEGFPRDLQSSRGWERAPWPGEGDLASFSS